MKKKRNKQRGGASRAVVAGLAIVPLAARLIDRPKAIGEESVPPFDGGTHRDVVHSTSITIPPRDFRSGPLTRKRQARAFAILGAMEAVGLVLAAAGKDLRWFVDGAPLAPDAASGGVVWRPGAAGFYRIMVVDAEGLSASARVRVRP